MKSIGSWGPFFGVTRYSLHNSRPSIPPSHNATIHHPPLFHYPSQHHSFQQHPSSKELRVTSSEQLRSDWLQSLKFRAAGHRSRHRHSSPATAATAATAPPPDSSPPRQARQVPPKPPQPQICRSSAAARCDHQRQKTARAEEDHPVPSIGGDL